MKKNTVITLVLILFFSGAVIFKSRGCRTDVPELEGWYEPADEIIVKGKDYSLTMIRKDNNWHVNEQGFPGDADLIGSMEKKARDFKLLDLVSDKGYYDKYDLTDEKGILVIIKSKGKVLRQMLVGKSGSTNNHVYLRVNDRKEIYLASGIMKNDFVLQADDVRQKEIINLKRDDIKSFSINYSGRKYEFHVKPQEENAGKDTKKDGEKSGPEWICKGYEKVRLRGNAINDILGLFSPLRASTYPENMERKNAGRTLCTVDIVTGDKKIELVIFDKKDKEMNLAASSESRYIFTLGNWQIEKLFIKNIKDITEK